MPDETSENLDRRAAIVCKHIALDGLPILRAVLDEPTMPEDSGWQFLCDRVESENQDEAKVWLIHEVLKLEPSLRPFIESQPETVLTRKHSNSNWEVTRKRPND
jgi:hypothetical protein